MMRKVLLNIFMVCVAVMGCAQSYGGYIATMDSVDVERVKLAVDALLTDYPDATLQDVYRVVFKIILAWRICWVVVNKCIIIYVVNLEHLIMSQVADITNHAVGKGIIVEYISMP